MSAAPPPPPGRTPASAPGRSWALHRHTVVAVVVAVVAALLSVVVAPAAQAAGGGVSTTRTASGFPRWYSDANGVRLEPCLDNDPVRCVLLADPGFDPVKPVVFPTNFPSEFFYSVVDSDVVNTPGCAGTRPGKALVRLALEGTFVGGTPVPGDQIAFARTRVTVSSGLCPNSTYTFTHPYGQITLTTDVDGALARNQATTDIGCKLATCDFTLPLTAPLFSSFLRWDPAVAPAATPGYLSGDATVLHPIVGASGLNSANAFRIAGPGLAAPLSTNLFTVAAKVAGPFQTTPEAADFGNQPTNLPSASRQVSFTNVTGGPISVTGLAVTPAGSPWSLDPAVPTTCTGTVAADATCTANLVFAPTVVGPVTANLALTHGSFRSPTLLPLSGAGTAAVAPSVTSAPAALDFARIIVGRKSAAQGIVVHNNGPGTYVVDGVTVADVPAGPTAATGGHVGDAARFLPVAANDCPATGLAPGLSCTVSVSFTPGDQRPAAAKLQVAGHVTGLVGNPAVALAADLTGRGTIASSSAANGVGPAGVGADGFATWYQDDRGVRLKQCLVNNPATCVLLADPGFNPNLPVSFPGNYPSEAFYFVADSDRMSTPGCGAASPAGTAGFRAATEQTFVSGTVVAGEQLVFDRIRMNVTSGLCPGRQYKFVHPYGEFTFTADDLGGLKRAAGTTDIGCVPTTLAPCDFDAAVLSPLSDGFLRWDATAPAAPAGTLGDAGVLHPVAGAPYAKPGSGTPQNKVELVDTTTNTVVASTNLFTVAGLADATQGATKYQTVSPAASNSPNGLDFGTLTVGTTSPARTVTLESVGTTGLTATAPSITGANAGDFTITGSTCGAVAVGAACTVTVTFLPTAPGARTAVLNLPSDVTNTWTGAVVLTGAGAGPAAVPAITATPTTLAFGAQRSGTTSAARTVTVTNTGSAPLTVSGLTLGGTDAASFAATGCTAAVAPGGTCTVSVTFAPATDGAKAATLTLASNAANAAPVVTLSGTGTTPGITLSRTAIAFPATTVGTAAPTDTVVVTNSGTGPLTVSGLTLTGVNAADFTATGCTTPVAAGASCTVTVGWTPGAAGARTATLAVASDAPGAAPTVALSGTGTAPPAPAISVTPTSLAFGNQLTGTSATQLVTVTNTGTANLTVSGVTVGGVDAASFTATGCAAPLGPGGICTVSVTFSPATTGAKAATLTIASNAAVAAPVVALSGTGTAAAVAVTPATVSFGSVVVGTAAATQAVTVTNTGTAPLTVSGLTRTGVNAAEFSATGCATAVAPGASCTVTVGFTPAGAGARTATLTVVSNAAGAAPTVALSGLGVQAVLSVTPTALTFGSTVVGTAAPTQTVTVANTGTAPLTVSGVTVGGVNATDFSQTNTCAVAVAPAGSCTVTVGFTPAAAGARSGTLSVATTAGTATVTLAGTGAAVVVATVPGAPVIGTATASGPTATANWLPPVSDGGSPITGYTVQARNPVTGEVFGSLVQPATARSLSFPSLPAGSWTFTVRAINVVGTGAASAVSNTVSVITFPGAPTIGTATVAGATSATVTWTAPANTGGTTITGYQVTARNGTGIQVASATAPGTATSFTLAGLATGVPVSFTVTAINAVGFGPSSAASNTVTPGASAPGAPVIGTATASGATATANWLPPVSDGGSPITGYTVQARNPVTGEVFGSLVQPATARSLSFPSLPAGSWTFTVRAINVIGTGAASAVSNTVNVITFPGSPTAVTAVAGSASATVSWTAPANTGGTTITSYVVSARNALGTQVASVVVPGTTRSTVVSGLPRFAAVQFVVTAVNPVGGSAPSAPSAFVLPF